MKVIGTVGIAILLCIAAVWWLADREMSAGGSPAAAASSDVDASQSIGIGAETPQRQSPRDPVISSEESGARFDAASGDAAPVVTHGGTLEAPALAQVVGHDAGSIPERATHATSAQPPAIDKTACEAAARTLSRSLRLYDVTPTVAIAYGPGLSTEPLHPNSGFITLKARLLAPLCSGADPFDPAYPVESEFVAISADSHTRILVGDHWISDGTVLSFLSEVDQNFFGDALVQSRRRRVEAGHNMSRERFDRQLARNPQALMSGL